MNKDDETLDSLLDELSEQFAAQCRNGDLPSIEEYAANHPNLAVRIRSIFPSIALMESLSRKKHTEFQLAQHLAGTHDLPFEQLGDFKIVREIGRGGMGVVFEAVQQSLDRKVAVKVLSRQANLDVKHLQRFEREARTASRLHHTNIAPVFGVGEADGYNFIVMQLIDGLGIDELIKRYGQYRRKCTEKENDDLFAFSKNLISKKENQRPSLTEELTRFDGDKSTVPGGKQTSPRPSSSGFPIQLGLTHFDSVARLGQQIADALAYAHEQEILHRDIKPGNLLLDKDGVAWIVDFGLAKTFEQDGVTRTNDVVGTLRYMAPEQIHSGASPTSDIYSLGLTLYELLTLQPVFHDSSLASVPSISQRKKIKRPTQIQRLLPIDLETIVLKCCDSEPKLRYQTARELADDLAAYLHGQPIKARPWTKLESFTRWCRDNPRVAALSMATFGMLLLAATLGITGYISTTAALNREQTALSQAVEEKDNAEKNLQIAVDSLTHVYDWFAPKSLGFATSFSDDNEEQVDVNFSTEISPETLALLEQLLSFFDEFAVKYRDRADLRLAVAKANVRIGDIRELLGEYESAQTAYADAAKTFDYYLNTSKNDVDSILNLSNLYVKLGAIRKIYFDDKRFKRDFENATGLLNPLIDHIDTLDDEQIVELANVYYLIGKANMPTSVLPRPGSDPLKDGIGAFTGHRIGQRRKSPTNPKLDQAIEVLGHVDGESPARDFLLAMSYRDQPVDQSGMLEKSTELLEKLVAENPGNPDYAFALSQTYERFTYRKSAPIYAEEFLRKSLSLTEELIEDHANAYQFALAHITAQFKLAVLLHKKAPGFIDRDGRRPPGFAEDSFGPPRRRSDRGGPPPGTGPPEHEAVQLLDQALNLHRKLVARFPDNEDYKTLEIRLKNARNRIRRQLRAGRPGPPRPLKN